MSQYQYKPAYQRNLPHIQPPGATFFVTFRLAGSIPLAVLRQLKEDVETREKQIAQIADTEEQARLLYLEYKRQFARWDNALDHANSGPFWLRQPEIAEIVVKSLHYRHGNVYDLHAFCVMPNHGHLVCTPIQKADGSYHALQTILHSLKRFTAGEGNKVLGREGQFWQHESYDHIIRDREEWERIVKYVLYNPVKAGLTKAWKDWPWTYLKE